MIKSYSSLFFWLGLSIVASLMFYHTCNRVTDLDQQLHNLNAQIQSEQETLHVLKAEWVYLANPARIEGEAEHHLNLQPTPPQHIATLQNIGEYLPLRDGREPQLSVQTAEVLAPQTSPVTSAAHPKHTHLAFSTTHINDHMLMQHSAATDATPDKIGAFISTIGLHP